MSSGKAIPLDHQYDYNEDSVLIYTPHLCLVYLLAHDQESFLKLKFENSICARTVRSDCSPGINIKHDEPGRSCVLEISDSTWPKDAHEAYTYIGTPYRDGAVHYVVVNHDIFHEILAESYSEQLLKSGVKEHDFIKKMFPTYD